MLHARPDYSRIQDPALTDPSLLKEGSTPIGADEPVFLIRAQDVVAADAVEAWAVLNYEAGGDQQLYDLAVAHAKRIREWQASHYCKTADL